MKPDYRIMHKHLTRWEGGLSRNPDDSAAKNPCPVPYNGVRGYHTNRGVTWLAFKRFAQHIGAKPTDYDRFFNLTESESAIIFKVGYWDPLKLDRAPTQVVANIFSQWAWGSGIGGFDPSKKKYVGALGLARDFFAEKEQMTCSTWSDILKGTLSRLSKISEKELMDELMDHRKAFLLRISRPGTKNFTFRNGWMARHASFYKFNLQFIQNP